MGRSRRWIIPAGILALLLLAGLVARATGAAVAVEGGDLRAWGDNRNGQLGNGATIDRAAPVWARRSGALAAIAAGWQHSLAIGADGLVLAWGDNRHGQLGRGGPAQATAPTLVPGLPAMRAVAAGDEHSLALAEDGRVWGWGLNRFGQVGRETADEIAAPAPVPGLESIVAIGAGHSHSLALRSDGTVWSWGLNDTGQLGIGAPCAQRCRSAIPLQVPGLNDVTALGAGLFHTLALRADGTVLAWGVNQDGRLGDGTTEGRLAPVPVRGLDGVRAVAAGRGHSLAIRADGTVWAWGGNGSGQLGTEGGDRCTSVAGDPVPCRRAPAPVAGIADVAALATWGDHVLALREDGTVWSWGENLDGELGTGAADRTGPPARVRGIRDATAIAAGDGHSLAITTARRGPPLLRKR